MMKRLIITQLLFPSEPGKMGWIFKVLPVLLEFY